MKQDATVVAHPQAAVKPHPDRRRFLIDPAFQLSATIPAGVAVVMFAVLLVAFVLYPMQQAVDAEPNPQIQAVLSEQLSGIAVRIWPLLAVAGVWAAVFALVRSVRYASPLLRLRRAIYDMAQGIPATFQLRRGDKLKDFEVLVMQLSQRLDSLGKRNRDLLLSVHGPLQYLSDELAKREMNQTEVRSVVEDVLSVLRKSPVIAQTKYTEAKNAPTA